jgi:hypothetical protein
MKDSRGNSVNVHSIGFDNEGWGALSNQIKWKCGNLTNYEEYTVEIKNVVFNGSSKDYTYKFTLGDGPAGAVPNATLIEPLNNAQNVAFWVGGRLLGNNYERFDNERMVEPPIWLPEGTPVRALNCNACYACQGQCSFPYRYLSVIEFNIIP